MADLPTYFVSEFRKEFVSPNLQQYLEIEGIDVLEGDEIEECTGGWSILNIENPLICFLGQKRIMIYNKNEIILFEYIQSLKSKQLNGSRGIFRKNKILRDEKEDYAAKKRQERKELQMELHGKQSWREFCPNCGSDNLSFCSICISDYVQEVQRVKKKIKKQKEGK